MTDPLPIYPFTQPLSANGTQSILLPGSKSITNRALILAALSHSHVTLTGALFSRDTQIMLKALQQLGFQAEADEPTRTIKVQGEKGSIPVQESTIHVGNAGTAARFLTAMLALRTNGKYTIEGDEAMKRRPMKGLTDALATQGTRFTFHNKEGHIPFTMETSGISGGAIEVDATASSQILSALMMAATYADSPTILILKGETVSKPFIETTRNMMGQFGAIEPERLFKAERVAYEITTGHYTLGEQTTYTIDPDATAASYFIILQLATEGKIKLPLYAYPELQGDVEFRGLAERVIASRSGTTADFNAFSDTFMSLAAVAPLLEGMTKIEGIGHTRHQECDRILAMATELEKLGQHIEPNPLDLTLIPALDYLQITPDYQALKTAVEERGTPITHNGQKHNMVCIDTYDDHRIAMSFAILGSHNLFGDGRPWLAINNPACCTKTFPDFFTKLEALRNGATQA